MFCPQGVTAVRWLSEINAGAPPSDQTPNSAARPSLVVASKSRSVFSPRRVLDVFACFGRPGDGGETGVKGGGGLPLGMLVQGSDAPSKNVRYEPKMAEGRPVYGGRT